MHRFRYSRVIWMVGYLLGVVLGGAAIDSVTHWGPQPSMALVAMSFVAWTLGRIALADRRYMRRAHKNV